MPQRWTTMTRTHLRVFLLVALILGAVSIAQAQYKVRDLGTLGGPESFAYDINDLGQVVGGASDASGVTVPFVWTKTAGMACVGKMPSASKANGVAAAINKTGQIAGWAVNKDGSIHPFRWTSKTGMVDLGNAYMAWGINDAGTVVGETFTNNHWMGFVWTADKGIRTIGMLDTRLSSGAYDMNSGNLVVGYSQDQFGKVTAVAWIGSQAIKFLYSSLFSASTAYGVNGKNEIVGTGGTHAAIWDKYFYAKDLGTLKSGGWTKLYDINDSSQAVGCCYVSARKYAVTWTAKTKLQQLTVPTTFTDAEAWAINGSGQIVGVAWDKAGKRHAIMWYK